MSCGLGNSQSPFRQMVGSGMIALINVVFPDAFLKRWLLATNENLTAEKLGEDFPKMIQDLKWHLIKDKLIKANELKIEATEIEAFAKKMARAQFAQYGMIGIEDDILANYAKETLQKEETVRNIADKVMEDKVLEAVKNSVKLNKKEISMDDFNKMFETK
jgi:trigger factor